VQRLAPVLNQFTETYKGNAQKLFWNNLYHERTIDDGYRPTTYVNGWLIRFFTLQDEA
jgi:hypothetical protein